jgi:hypothetical protein
MPDSSSPRAAAGTLIAIGAGARRNFLHRLSTDARPAFDHIILIDPDATACRDLARRFAGFAGTEIITAALSERSGPGELLHYNFPRLVSLHPPGDALHHLFPGLRIRDRTSVQMCTVTDLKPQLAHAPRPLTVVITSPGSELDILRGLQESGLLHDIQILRIRCAAEPMFDNNSARPAIRRWLESRYFTLYGTDQSDPDWPEIRFRADEAALEMDLMRVETDVLQQVRAEQTTQLQELQAQIVVQDNLIATQTAELSEQEQALLGRQEALSEAQAQASTLQTDLRLTLRMQAIALADLEDLREKYREGQQIRAQQENLLRQLTPRLHQAAQQLRAISPDLMEPDQMAPPDQGRSHQPTFRSRKPGFSTLAGKPVDDG